MVRTSWNLCLFLLGRFKEHIIEKRRAQQGGGDDNWPSPDAWEDCPWDYQLHATFWHLVPTDLKILSSSCRSTSEHEALRQDGPHVFAKLNRGKKVYWGNMLKLYEYKFLSDTM